MGTLGDHIRSYYDALDTGDPDKVAAHFCDDAVHYYTRLGPHVGARSIGEHTKLGVEVLGGKWFIENVIEEGDQAVIEWTMTWRDPKSGEPRLDRGTEWFLFRDGKIAEVRAYHHSDPSNRQGNLLGFDHAGRGHTMLAGDTETLIRDSFAAMNRRDIDGLARFFTSDAEWHSDPRLPGAKAHIGRDDVVAFLREFLEPWDEYRLEVTGIEGEGDRVLVTTNVHMRGAASGVEDDLKMAYLVDVEGDRFARVQAFVHGEGAREAFEASA